ncbi:DUF7562 family protein [Halocatena halophila]|uniref:DUF7562 family protein n=1 Tax=Halocatena halophila TaxID=2814576 RepID=UPI002ED4DC2B
MWDLGLGSRDCVTCISCGSRVSRSSAREYDKQGDRWNRRKKSFEHLCKPCYREIDHHSRERLEQLLVAVEQSSVGTNAEFIRRYYQLVTEFENQSMQFDDR